ncbi:error-prone DNA polymerase [Paraburkholderia caballeronis]|uniref:Error-prone DNA polymerase n=1 Tax=Paraburkholderia caballeronis TaxID=416943 RepID=A0A1H7U8E3_9BURK|nr:error-prone DNA polymerase [Paraburkholderia caballeronis]PXW23331.1 DNA polymerase III alpha subunit [Paraburkholderia caballeronis]PXW98324.1 DNA polymerase III alpha subunit [Paraburkholderia caballeronis]RAJ95054.1 DNA polymerase III alpha subunit [Paraburkholderia caballeronis]SEC59511.1 DNA polymerase III, alpha subunit [Paraburkholderia caballeronis]SEL93350.1 DNA polymerase III, alpha subunit [Paraburkholderia caballeronis]
MSLSDPPRAAPSSSFGGLPDYAELHCLTNFTFLRGASHPGELIEQASEHGYRALAITDECSLAGVVRAHSALKEHEAARRNAHADAVNAAREQGGEAAAAAIAPLAPALHLLIGSELSLVDQDGKPFCTLVAIAMNREGYGNLCELITLARSRAAKGSYRLHPADFTAPEPEFEHLRHLRDCVLLLVPQRAATFAQTLRGARWLAGFAADRAWLALELWCGGSDETQIDALRLIARNSGLPLVATGGVLMHARSRKPLQDTLSAIRVGRPLATCGRELEPNAERHLRARVRLASLYPHDTLRETLEVARRCTFSLDELAYEYPEELVPAGETPATWLRTLVMQGAAERWPDGLNEKREKQINLELGIIAELKYEKYFLTVHDIVRFARSQGILCQGRGSAANSVVCYCLKVTEIDPVRMNMLVERFISRARNEPPDIDVDFEHQRREEVIQYIYGKYGNRRAALAATLITYRTRSAVKDVGKALGLDAALIERIGKAQQWWDGPDAVAHHLEEAGFSPDSHVTQHLVRLTRELRGFPRHLSQHVGGFVIAKDKLSRLVPIENAAMADRYVIEWDKDDIDALRLLKVDVLALGMLSAIRRSLEFVALRRGLPAFRVQDIPAEDPAVYEMCCHADTVGVFQIESRAQQSMLPRLRPRKYYDLVIEVAIVRPGPIQGGMVHPYLKRKQGLEDVVYEKPELRPVLERTLGIPIFQEQVMHLAMVAANFSGEEADKLRRAMAAWRRDGDLRPYQADLKRRMMKKGYEEEFADRICKQIEGFGDYGFPESHAASFALLVYNSAWLKRYEPAAFLAGLLNSQPLGFYSPSQLVQDAKRHGVKVLAPDIAISDWESTLEQPEAPGVRIAADAARMRQAEAMQKMLRWRAAISGPKPRLVTNVRRVLRARVVLPPHRYGRGGPAVRLGFSLVKGFSEEAAQRVMQARAFAPFIDVDDLARRAALTRRELEALAAANALASIAGHRREAWWAVTAQHAVPALLRDAPIAEAPLALPRASEGAEIVADYASLRLTLNRHPLELLRRGLAKQRFKTSAQLAKCRHGTLARVCGIVTVRQRPGTANGTIFVSLEDETGSVNVIVREALVESQRKELLGASLMAVAGVVQREGEVVHLVAQRLEDHSRLLGRLATESRNFH